MTENQEEKKLDRRKQAVALQYDVNDRLPKVVASGAGELARKILELAAENDIPVEKNSSLTELLAQLDIEQHIPEEAFKAVAAILAFLYRADEEWRRKKGFAAPTKSK